MKVFRKEIRPLTIVKRGGRKQTGMMAYYYFFNWKIHQRWES